MSRRIEYLIERLMDQSRAIGFYEARGEVDTVRTATYQAEAVKQLLLEAIATEKEA